MSCRRRQPAEDKQENLTGAKRRRYTVSATPDAGTSHSTMPRNSRSSTDAWSFEPEPSAGRNPGRQKANARPCLGLQQSRDRHSGRPGRTSRCRTVDRRRAQSPCPSHADRTTEPDRAPQARDTPITPPTSPTPPSARRPPPAAAPSAAAQRVSHVHHQKDAETAPQRPRSAIHTSTPNGTPSAPADDEGPEQIGPERTAQAKVLMSWPARLQRRSSGPATAGWRKWSHRPRATSGTRSRQGPT